MADKTFMHKALEYRNEEMLRFLKEEVAAGKERLRVRHQWAVQQKTEDGKQLSPAYSQQVRTQSKRDLRLLETLECLINAVDPCKLSFNENAFRGLDRVLYPTRRDNKSWSPHGR